MSLRTRKFVETAIEKNGDSSDIGFKEFCEQTSLHGWGFITFGRSKAVQTIFWLIAISSAFALCMSLTFINLKEFMTDVEFNVETLAGGLEEVYFPAFYIINHGKDRKSVVHSIVKDLLLNHESENATQLMNSVAWDVFNLLNKGRSGEPLNQHEKLMASMVLKSNLTKELFDSFVDKNKVHKPKVTGNAHIYHNHSIQFKTSQEIQDSFDNLEVSPYGYLSNLLGFNQLHDFLMYLKFPGEGVLHFGGSFSDIDRRRNMFIPFFKPPGSGSLTNFIKPFAKAGFDNGVNMLIDSESYDIAQFNEEDKVYGHLVIGIAHPFDSELAQFHAIEVEPGMQIKMSVFTHQIKTSRNIRFDPAERNCYFDDEIELDHFPSHWFRYSIDNCLLEAKFQKIESICNCTTYLAKSLPKGYNFCRGEQLSCLGSKAVRDIKVGNSNFIKSNGEVKSCRVNCNDQPFRHSISSTRLHVTAMRKYAIEKLNESCHNFKKPVLTERYKTICEVDFEKAKVIHFYFT